MLFRSRIFAELLGFPWACRPNGGIKSLDRIREKAIRGVIPLDMLGGKLIVPAMQIAYQVGDKLEQHFTIVAFKDRFEIPTPSGYRDLQFIVSMDDLHFAELKIVHKELDDFDSIEHRIYEIVRDLHNRLDLTAMEQKVLQHLQKTSQTLYDEIWQGI